MYCLPGSEYLRAEECVLGYTVAVHRPETSSQVTVATLSTAFQTVSIFVPESVYWVTVAVTPRPETLSQVTIAALCTALQAVSDVLRHLALCAV